MNFSKLGTKIPPSSRQKARPRNEILEEFFDALPKLDLLVTQETANFTEEQNKRDMLRKRHLLIRSKEADVGINLSQS